MHLHLWLFIHSSQTPQMMLLQVTILKPHASTERLSSALSSSQVDALGKWIGVEDWALLLTSSDVDTQLDLFTRTIFTMLDAIAPEKTIKISLDDPPLMNTRIKTIIRQRNREYDNV